MRKFKITGNQVQPLKETPSISKTEIKPLTEKLDSIHDMLPPRNPKEVRQFPSFALYYRKFCNKSW